MLNISKHTTRIQLSEFSADHAWVALIECRVRGQWHWSNSGNFRLFYQNQRNYFLYIFFWYKYQFFTRGLRYEFWTELLSWNIHPFHILKFDVLDDFVHSMLVQFYLLLCLLLLSDQDRLHFEFCQNCQNISTKKIELNFRKYHKKKFKK